VPTRTSIVNLSGDNPETIIQWAKDLGTSKIRRRLFNTVYGRGEKPRSKKQLMKAAKIDDRDAQQTQNELDHLSSTHLIIRDPNDGLVNDGSRYVYRKDPGVRAYRERIIRFADHPRDAGKVPTKRAPLVRGIRLINSVPTKRDLRKKRRLSVLYLTANSRKDLDLDEEFKLVLKEVRGSIYRDNIRIEHRPAADVDSVVDGLNDLRPRVVHFSGHGNATGIALKSRTGGVSFDLLKKLLSATDTPPDVVVLNSCKSADARRMLIPPAKAIVVMRDSISDFAASIFATKFYGAIAAGQSVKKAFEQGVVAIEAAAIGDFDIPVLLVADGINPGAMVLT
jgi:hypothetical protein